MTPSARSLVQALGFGVLILAVSLSPRIAFMLGWITDAELGQRMVMVVLGVFFVVTGNALPKRLIPLSSSRCSGTKSQSLTRLMGWVQVLWGLTFIGASLLLPPDTAEVVIVASILVGAFVVITRIVRMRQARQPELRA